MAGALPSSRAHKTLTLAAPVGSIIIINNLRTYKFPFGRWSHAARSAAPGLDHAVDRQTGSRAFCAAKVYAARTAPVLLLWHCGALKKAHTKNNGSAGDNGIGRAWQGLAGPLYGDAHSQSANSWPRFLARYLFGALARTPGLPDLPDDEDGLLGTGVEFKVGAHNGPTSASRGRRCRGVGEDDASGQCLGRSAL